MAYTPAGNKIQPTYSRQIINGVRQLTKTGETKIYEKIQENKDECDIKKIIERYIKGDVEALNRNTLKYGDMTILPKSLNELNQIRINAENEFKNFPVDLREQFDNSYDKFLYEIENGAAKAKLDKYFNRKEEKTVEQPTKNEQIEALKAEYEANLNKLTQGDKTNE